MKKLWLIVAAFGLLAVQTAPAAAQQATPSAEAGNVLAAMLANAPDVAPGTMMLATYADLSLWSEQTGVTLPENPTEEQFGDWLLSFNGAAIADPFLSYALAADWSTLVGFDLADLTQTVQVGDPPDIVTLLRGNFDLARLQAAWEAQGYQPVEIDGVRAAASLHEGPEIDLSSELGKIALARMNNVAVLEDGTLVYTPTLTALEAVAATGRRDAPALADRVDVAALLAAQPEPLASAVIVDGSAFQATPFPNQSPEAIQTQTASLGELGPITMGLIGVNPNPVSAGTPDVAGSAATVRISALFPTAALADAAIPVIESRLETGVSLASQRPLTDYFGDWTASLAESGPVVNLELTLAPEVPAGIWLQMLFNRDLVFLAW
jgi:hypothetical protein